MYHFGIKEEGPDLEILITRAMLALAAIAALVYRSDKYVFLNWTGAILLLALALFIRYLLDRFRIKRILLVIIAAAILVITTRSVVFALVLVLYGYLVKFLHRPPGIGIGENGVLVKKFVGGRLYKWEEFSNIVLKDSLLTLDFQNNRLIQVTLLEPLPTAEEAVFNEFCRKHLR